MGDGGRYGMVVVVWNGGGGMVVPPTCFLAHSQ